MGNKRKISLILAIVMLCGMLNFNTVLAQEVAKEYDSNSGKAMQSDEIEENLIDEDLSIENVAENVAEQEVSGIEKAFDIKDIASQDNIVYDIKKIGNDEYLAYNIDTRDLEVYITDGYNPICGAEVTVANIRMLTNSDGIASFFDIPTSTEPYTVTVNSDYGKRSLDVALMPTEILSRADDTISTSKCTISYWTPGSEISAYSLNQNLDSDIWSYSEKTSVKNICYITEYNGLIYIFGDSAQVYDPQTGIWSVISSTSLYLDDFILYKDKIYCYSSGWSADGDEHWTAWYQFYEYDLKSNTWTAIEDGEYGGFFDATIIAYNDYIYFIGGYEVEWDMDTRQARTDVDVFDIKNKQWVEVFWELYDGGETEAFVCEEPGEYYGNIFSFDNRVLMRYGTVNRYCEVIADFSDIEYSDFEWNLSGDTTLDFVDGKIYIVNGYNGDVYIYDIESKELSRESGLSLNDNKVVSMHYGKKIYLFVGGDKTTLHVYDTSTGLWQDIKCRDDIVVNKKCIAFYKGIIYAMTKDGILCYYAPETTKEVQSTIAIGDNHIVYLKDGEVYTKGDNTYGQLGTGDNNSRENFVKINGGWGDKKIIKATTRSNTTFALTEDNVLYGWGRNDKYQLGDSTNIDKNVPVQIMDNVADVEVGLEHTVVRMKNNEYIYAWGDNTYNQVNSSDDKVVSTPYLTWNYGQFIDAGDYQTYYHGTDEELAGKGKNDRGELGYYNPFGYGAPYVIKVNSSAGHSMAIDSNNNLYVWGDNTLGQLGIKLSDGNEYTDEPIEIRNYIQDADVGGNRTEYITMTGNVYRAGKDYLHSYDEFSEVKNAENMSNISVGSKYTLGLDIYGNIWRWGVMTDNAEFSLNKTTYTTPLKNCYPYGFIDIDSRRTQTIGINDENKVVAWGTGYYGDGTDKEATHYYPEEIELNSDIIPTSVVRGKNFNLIVDQNGDVWGFGSNTDNPMGKLGGKVKTPTKLNDISNVKSAAAGDGFSIFLKNDGTLWGMGLNGSGQLGQGDTNDVNTPVRITNKNDFIKVDAGDSFVVAIAEDGVYTFGSNEDGQLGRETKEDNAEPKKLNIEFEEPYEKIVDVSASTNYCLALTNKGNVYSWGRNGSGQLGIGNKDTQTKPVKVQSLSDIEYIFAENVQSFAIKKDGTVYGWGHGSNGQLANTNTGTQQRPIKITALNNKDIKAVVCGSGYGIALSRNGYMYSFGSNADGALGIYSESAQLYMSDELEDMRWLREYMFGIGDDITSDISLPTIGPNGSTIIWESSNSEYISSTGKVHRPDAYGKDTNVTLTATIVNADRSKIAKFNLTVLQDKSKQPSTDIPIRSIGMEYDQVYPETMPEIYPEITGVSFDIIDKENGIYEFVIQDNQFKCAENAKPFFFWNSRQGTFLPIDGCDDYRHVRFTVDPDELGKTVKVIVGIGDRLGYIDRKAVIINSGASETSKTSEYIMTDFSAFDTIYGSDLGKANVAIGIDTSVNMLNFDTGNVKAHISSIEGLIDTLGDNANIALVDKDNIGYPKDIESAQNSLALMTDMDYSGETDALTLLERCDEALSDAENISQNGNKAVVLLVQHVDNIDFLRDKINDMENRGISVDIMLLSNESYDLEQVKSCDTLLKLHLNMAELYSALSSLPQPISLYSNTATSTDTLVSSYKSDKHKLNINNNDKLGAAVAEILNMYNCLPAFANYEDSEYNLMATSSLDDIYNIFCGNTSEISLTSANKIADFYQNIWESRLSDSAFSYTGTAGELTDIIDKNLKCRFPVIAVDEDNNVRIIVWKDYGELKDSNNGIILGSETLTIIDTYSYLLAIANQTCIVDKTEYTNKFYDNIRFNVPNGYQISDINYSLYKGSGDNLTLSIGDNMATFTNLAYDNQYLVVIRTVFDGALPNIYNSTKYYKVLEYTDQKSTNQKWYYPYLFKATNLGIVKGNIDENNIVTFDPEAEVTRAAFLKMVLCTSGIMSEEDQIDDGETWADNYIDEAVYRGLVEANGNPYYWYESNATRKEVADIMTKLFIHQYEDVPVPTLLYEYDKDMSCEKNTILKNPDRTIMLDIDPSSKGQIDWLSDDYEGCYQMFMNSIMEGDDEGLFAPYDSLTRAQACKILVKSLFHLDGEVPQIWADYIGEDEYVTNLSVDTDGYESNIEFGVNNKRVYNITLTDDLNVNTQFIITTTGANESSQMKISLTNADTNAIINSISMTNDLYNPIYKVPAGNYKLIVERNGNTSIGLKITYVNAPQEIKFDQNAEGDVGSGNYYIFVDQPEHIRTYDIINGTEPPRTLMDLNDLGPGKYTYFEYHHKATEYIADKDENGNPYRRLFWEGNNGGAFGNNVSLYYDGIFYNKPGQTGTIKVTKLGCTTEGNGKKWDIPQTYDCFNGCYDGTSMFRYTIPSDEKKITSTNSFKISEMLDNDEIKINQNYTDDMGYLFIMMEFEVTGGSVSFSSMAAENSPDFSAFNNGNIKCRYEDQPHQCIKGMGEFDQVIDAQELNYYFDGTNGYDEVALPVKIKNSVYSDDTVQKDYFTTNSSPLYSNLYDNYPESAVLSITYKGLAGNENRTMTFDPYHLPYTFNANVYDSWVEADTNKRNYFFPKSKSVPEAWQDSYPKSSFEVNEKFDFNWLKTLVRSENDEDAKKIMNDYQNETMMQGYGVKHRYKINLYNLSEEEERYFKYQIKITPSYYVEVFVNGESKFNKYFTEAQSSNEAEADSEKTFTTDEVALPSKQCTQITLELTQMPGSNATAENMFIIK